MKRTELTIYTERPHGEITQAQEKRTRGKNVRKNVQKISIANSSLGTKKRAIGKKTAQFLTPLHGKRKDTLLFLDRRSAQRVSGDFLI